MLYEQKVIKMIFVIINVKTCSMNRRSLIFLLLAEVESNHRPRRYEQRTLPSKLSTNLLMRDLLFFINLA